MKKRSISDIAHRGGFPRAIDDVVRTNTPLIVTLRGEPTVMISPCPPTLEATLADIEAFGKVAMALAFGELDDVLSDYLTRQYMIGLIAQGMLYGIDRERAEQVFEAGKELVKRMDKPAMELGTSMMQKFYSVMRNSSEEGGSVSPMTTARADVSEVKQEGVDSTPSLPRKRGRPRKN